MNIIERTVNANVRTRRWLYEQLVKIDDYLQTLTGGGGIIDLTQEDFDALVVAEEIVLGQAYNITDANFGVLFGASATTVKPLGGRMTIQNGDTLPAGIEPDVLMVDTGVITGSTLEVTAYSGYYFKDALINVINEELLTVDSFLGNVTSIDLTSGAHRLFANTNTLNDNNNITTTYNGGDNNYRAIIEFHKSPFL